jgi:hypothetical protein
MAGMLLYSAVVAFVGVGGIQDLRQALTESRAAEWALHLATLADLGDQASASAAQLRAPILAQLKADGDALASWEAGLRQEPPDSALAAVLPRAGSPIAAATNWFQHAPRESGCTAADHQHLVRRLTSAAHAAPRSAPAQTRNSSAAATDDRVAAPDIVDSPSQTLAEKIAAAAAALAMGGGAIQAPLGI